MKFKLLLLAILCISVQITAQQFYCPFTYYVSPGTNTVSFTPNSYYSGGQYHYMWTFGDSTSSTLANPTHTFPSSNPWTVECFVYDAVNNPVCTTGEAIYIIPPYNCGLSVALVSTTDTFEFASQPLSGAHIEWDFGDGSPTSTLNPVRHAYTQIGNYNCTSYQKDSLGNIMCQHTEVMNVYSTHGCYINTSTSGGGPLDVVFISTAPAGYTVDWNFGDNTTGTGHQVQHYYTQTGVYPVNYVAYDSLGDTCYSNQSIQVGVPGTNCSFTAQYDSLIPTTMTFTSGGSSSNVHWDFGDGMIDSGTIVTHTFASIGFYFVCMSESDSTGITCQHCDTIFTDTVNCLFQWTSGPLSFDFMTSPGNYLTTWDFGDSTSDVGNMTSHVYLAPGLYQVCMNKIDSITGSAVCSYCLWLTAAYPSNCHASYVASTQGLAAYFIDQSVTDSSSAYYWDFGDGDSAITRFPQHTYAMSGAYAVCLTVNSSNCMDTYCDSINVSTGGNPGCDAFFAIVQTAPYQIAIVNLSMGTSINYNWDFGDGNSDSTAYPLHFYNNTGSYNLCLTVSDSLGCNDTFCDTLNVDSLGNVFRYAQTGFSIMVISPAQITGTNEINTSKPLNIYPNPFGTELNISSGEKDKIESYAVYSVQGKLISKGRIANGQGKIETINFANGAYLLEVKLEHGSRIYRMVIKK
jgi:PKD repeat protein